MQHVAPDLVLPLSEAGSGAAGGSRSRPFARDGVGAAELAPGDGRHGVGNPAAATPEKGKRYVEAVTEKVATFLVDLAKADTAKLYE